MLSTILITRLILVLIRTLPRWPHAGIGAITRAACESLPGAPPAAGVQGVL
jgi:hypothetical protein